MDTPNPIPELTSAEARALGCLIEKAATTPEAYPLTVNAALVAANQKTARDPVMALNPGDVHHALRQLEAKGLARQVFSSRAERYEHRAELALGLTKQQTALLGLLLLRGAQTAGELLARSERLASFADLDDLRHQLDRLCQRQPAPVVQIPRGPGQREDRYAHQLCGAVDVAAIAASAPVQTSIAAGGLEGRVAALEEEVAALRAQLAQWRDARDADRADGINRPASP